MLARGMVARFLPRAALLLATLTFGSYVLGLVRDRIFARTFGAGPELDAYNAAFVLPELTLDVLVASGLAAPFVPIFLQLRLGHRPGEGTDKAEEFAQTILTGAVVTMTAAATLMFVLAEQTAGLIAPGFDAAERALYVTLFRVMLLTPIIFGASLALGEVLLAERRWVSYGVAPLMYNAGIILGTVALAPSAGILGPAVGAVVGALLHLGVRVLGLRGSSTRIRPRLDIRTPAIRDFVRLMLPKMASHPVEPITFLYFTNVASTLAAGSVTAVSFARNFQSVPVSLIGIAFSIAAFPSLAAAYAVGDRRAFTREFAGNLGTIVVLTTAAGVMLYVLSRLVIEVLLGGGAFDAGDVATTSAVLAVFALSVPLESVTHLLSRAIYATRHTFLQVLSAIGGLGVTVLATNVLVPSMGILAIPLGFALGTGAKVVFLGIALAYRLHRFRPPSETDEVGPPADPPLPNSSG